jgi:hypothetical protein
MGELADDSAEAFLSKTKGTLYVVIASDNKALRLDLKEATCFDRTATTHPVSHRHEIRKRAGGELGRRVEGQISGLQGRQEEA